MSFVCNDCNGNPDFKTKCELQTSKSLPLFYCPTCSIGCRISNFIRAHVNRCVKPAGSAVGMATRMEGFATPEEALADRKRISASPSPGPSLAPPPQALLETCETSRYGRGEAKEDGEGGDRSDRKREVALEFARKQKEEVKEKEKERLRKWERENVFAAVAAAPLPMFKKRTV